MNKIELKYVLKNTELFLEKETKDLKCFLNKTRDWLLVTDKDGNILLNITADCGQNQGYMTIEN